MIVLDKPESEFESRKHFLAALFCAFVAENGYVNMSEDSFEYDGTECDIFCLADDVKVEFGLSDDDVAYTTKNA